MPGCGYVRPLAYFWFRFSIELSIISETLESGLGYSSEHDWLVNIVMTVSISCSVAYWKVKPTVYENCNILLSFRRKENLSKRYLRLLFQECIFLGNYL